MVVEQYPCKIIIIITIVPFATKLVFLIRFLSHYAIFITNLRDVFSYFFFFLL